MSPNDQTKIDYHPFTTIEEFKKNLELIEKRLSSDGNTTNQS